MGTQHAKSAADQQKDVFLKCRALKHQLEHAQWIKSVLHALSMLPSCGKISSGVGRRSGSGAQHDSSNGHNVGYVVQAVHWWSEICRGSFRIFALVMGPMLWYLDSGAATRLMSRSDLANEVGWGHTARKDGHRRISPGVDVHGICHRLVLIHLWCSISKALLFAVALRVQRESGIVSDLLRDSEVGDDSVPVVFDKDIGRFEACMDDSETMKIDDALKDVLNLQRSMSSPGERHDSTEWLTNRSRSRSLCVP